MRLEAEDLLNLVRLVSAIENCTGNALRVRVFVMDDVLVSEVLKMLEYSPGLWWLIPVYLFVAQLEACRRVSETLGEMYSGAPPECLSHCWRIDRDSINCFQACVRKLQVVPVQHQIRNSVGLWIIQLYQFHSIGKAFNVQASLNVSD
jgi:hypothetical protein